MATHTEMIQMLGLQKLLDPILEQAYVKELEEHFRSGDFEWGSSFHGSSFPYGKAPSCARDALYGMMGYPAEPISSHGAAIMSAGKSIELEILRLLHSSGTLLHPHNDHSDDDQWHLVDEEHWLVGHVDAIIVPPRWTEALPVEVKSKDHDKVLAMRNGVQGPDPWHIAQLMCYIHLFRQNWESMRFPEELGRPTMGILLYVSRNRPRTTHEFVIQYDEEGAKEAMSKIAKMRDAFLADRLPPRDPAWKWTEDPCGWCERKKFCKKDVKEGVDSLSASNGREKAVEIYGAYDPDEVRKAVIDRWTSRAQ